MTSKYHKNNIEIGRNNDISIVFVVRNEGHELIQHSHKGEHAQT